MLDTCLCFPCEMEPWYCLYMPILTMVVFQASQVEEVVVMSSLMDQDNSSNEGQLQKVYATQLAGCRREV